MGVNQCDYMIRKLYLRVSFFSNFPDVRTSLSNDIFMILLKDRNFDAVVLLNLELYIIVKLREVINVRINFDNDEVKNKLR